MGFWTFGGAGGGGKKQDGAQTFGAKPDNSFVREKSRADTSMSGQQSTHSKRDVTAKKASRDRTPSLPQPPRSQTAPALTGSKSAQNVRYAGRKKETGLYQNVPSSQASLNHDGLPEFHGPPTLFAKRAENGNQSPRSKPARRRTDEYAREREIRAMTSSPIPIPKRPNNIRSESPLLREKRLISSGLKRESSEISLPLPGSLSHLDFTATQSSFKIGMLAALSPRPNIQYDSQARTPSGKQPLRAGLAVQKAIEEEDVSELKRIDELADDLDAGGLRELMERDRKRREKKKELDKAKLLMRLERRALKDREEETRRARTEAYVRESSPANVERRRGRKPDVAESQPQKSTKKSSTQKQSTKEKSNDPQSSYDTHVPKTEPEPQDPFADENDVSKADASVVAPTKAAPLEDAVNTSKVAVPAPIRNPFEDEQDIVTPDFDMGGDDVDLSLPARSPLRPSGRKVETDPFEVQPPVPVPAPVPTSPQQQIAGRSSLSRRSLSAFSRSARSDKTDDVGHERKKSETNNVRLSTWTNFFSKGTRRKLTTPLHGNKADPEFSNTSRESVQRKQLPPVVTDRSFKRSSTGTPQRTLSKFREDLPEHPVSSPGEGIQPTLSATSPVRILDVSQQRIIDDDDNDDTYSIQQSIDIASRPTSTTAAPLPLTMASVDSEGSWLSGRPSRRVSVPGGIAQTIQRSPSTQQKGNTLDMQAQDEARDVVNYDQHQRVSSDDIERPPFETRTERVPGSTLMDAERNSQTATPPPPALPPKSDKRESLHADARRRPTLVNQGDRIQSHAGLLNDVDATPGPKSASNENVADEDDVESPGSVEIIDGPLLRAQSVEYKGHARAVSAGSAKLLDIRRISTHSDLGRPRSPTVARKSALGLSQDDSLPGTPTTID